MFHFDTLWRQRVWSCSELISGASGLKQVSANRRWRCHRGAEDVVQLVLQTGSSQVWEGHVPTTVIHSAEQRARARVHESIVNWRIWPFYLQLWAHMQTQLNWGLISVLDTPPRVHVLHPAPSAASSVCWLDFMSLSSFCPGMRGHFSSRKNGEFVEAVVGAFGNEKQLQNNVNKKEKCPSGNFEWPKKSRHAGI